MGKANVFIDKRAGEHTMEKGAPLTDEEKAIRRLKLERKERLKRAAVYNLTDATDELPTHLGDEEQAPPARAARAGGADDEDDFGHLDDDDVGDGGADDGAEEFSKPQAAKTRREIMTEVMLKAKYHKAERQKGAEDLNQMLESLDGEFATVRTLMEFKGEAERDAEKAAADDFTLAAKQLSSDPRGRGSMRLKTPEEVAKEERERLEQLEKERLRRMQFGADTLPPVDPDAGKRKRRDEDKDKKKKKDKAAEKGVRFARTDDDLDTNLALDKEHDAEDSEGEVEPEKGKQGAAGSSEDEDGEGSDDDEEAEESGDEESGAEEDEEDEPPKKPAKAAKAPAAPAVDKADKADKPKSALKPAKAAAPAKPVDPKDPNVRRWPRRASAARLMRVCVVLRRPSRLCLSAPPRATSCARCWSHGRSLSMTPLCSAS